MHPKEISTIPGENILNLSSKLEKLRITFRKRIQSPVLEKPTSKGLSEVFLEAVGWEEDPSKINQFCLDLDQLTELNSTEIKFITKTQIKTLLLRNLEKIPNLKHLGIVEAVFFDSKLLPKTKRKEGKFYKKHPKIKVHFYEKFNDYEDLTSLTRKEIKDQLTMPTI